ncbi:IS6 family transposase [Chloroflexota bacterium]
MDGKEITDAELKEIEKEVDYMVRHLKVADLVAGSLPVGTPVAEMEKVHTTEPEVITCPRCGSQDTMKYGFQSGMQMYICQKCRAKFNTKQAPLGMRTPAVQIGSALAMFYDGLSLADISRQLEQTHGNPVNPSSIYRWIQRYTKEAVERFGNYQAQAGRIWAADETVLGVRMAQTNERSPNTLWYWDVIDEDSRFLLASHMSNTRTIRDAEALFAQVRDRATTAPQFIVTDKLAAYIDGIERVFGAETRHIQSQGMRTDTHNNIIERFHGTIKERTKVMRDLKSPESAKLIMGGWAIHYNFFRPHMSLKGKTPAEAAGIVTECTSWVDVVQQSIHIQRGAPTLEELKDWGFSLGVAHRQYLNQLGKK